MTTAPRPDRLSRSMLYVPASRPDMIEKAARSAADAVCIDLEDAVAPAEKEASRANVVRALTTIDFGDRTRLVRINALDTRYAYRDLVDVVEAAGRAIDLVMMPKARNPDDVKFVDTLLGQIEANAEIGHRIGIEAQIETAGGFIWLREIAAASTRLESLIFGSGDYAASMRMPLASIGEADESDAAYPGHRWHAVMHGIVAAARAHGLRAMDGPYADFKDAPGFDRACQVARALGYDGKQCIHPSQLSTVNTVFAPLPDEVAWARQVVAAYGHAAGEGRGAFAVDGRMIDAANIRLAKTTLDRVRAIEARAKGAAG
jgi:citrate lyase subunit beta/citryl-CoA lyase